jgi:hypothetical protein
MLLLSRIRGFTFRIKLEIKFFAPLLYELLFKFLTIEYIIDYSFFNTSEQSSAFNHEDGSWSPSRRRGPQPDKNLCLKIKIIFV